MNLNQVTLPALDIAESAHFYRRMGFTHIVDSPHYARFECPQGDATFSLHKVESLAGDTGVTVYFEETSADTLDALVARLSADGFDFVEHAVDQPYLWREARLRDPAGNLLCLFWAGENRKNPPWRVKSS
jgi:catechol 2,3-dioxygenase-like lactoylglutathione lyase family enzyme